MSVALIWAEARGGVIGHAGGIPWRLPEDLARFRAVTNGGTVVMGRRTWESLPERFRPLPGRRNVVVTRQTEWESEGAEIVHSVEEALVGRADDAIWVIGGGEIYRQALALADRLEITEVDLDVKGDTVAPEIGEGWQRSVEPAAGWFESTTGLRYRFATLTRD
jgi:dihydrofolate reductase